MEQCTTAQQKVAFIGENIKTASGRQKIAASMQEPLRLRRDYASVIRKAFYVEALPDGALPYYDKDPEVTAYMIAEEGENIVSEATGERVLFPLFEISSNPEIPLSQIKERRYDLIERAQDLGKSQVQAAEDGRGFAIMDAVIENGFGGISGASLNDEILATGSLTVENLSSAFAEVEQHDMSVSNVFVNAKDLGDLRNWGRDTFDPETQKSLLKVGVLGQIWGATIIRTRLVDAGFVYVCGEPEMVGRIPVRTELTVLSADDPKARRIGFSIFEHIGIGCHNPLALCRIRIAR